MRAQQVDQQGVETASQGHAPKVDPVAGPGGLALQRSLRTGNTDVDSIAPIVERFPAERDALFESLNRSLGNSFVQRVVGALGARQAAGDEEFDPATPNMFDVAQVSADTTTNTLKITDDKTAPPQEVRQKPPKEKQYNDYAVKPAGPRTQTIAPDTYHALDGSDVAAINTSPEEGAILNAVRHEARRFDAEALQLAQGALTVTNASGAFNTETLRKLAEKTGTTTRKAAKGKPQEPPLITGANIVDPAFWLPFYNADAQKKLPLFMPDAVVGAAQAADGSVTTADRAAHKMGAANYQDYYKRILQPTPTFLGKTVRGERAHPDLIARLAAAEKFLTNFYKDKKDAKQQPYSPARIAQEISWGGDSVTVYDQNPDRIVTKGQVVQKADPAKGIEEKRIHDVYAQVHYHNMGLAVDFDPGVNPYIFDYSDPYNGAKAYQQSENKKARDKNDADRKADPTVEKINEKDQIDPDAKGKEWASHLDGMARAAYKQAADLYGGPPLASSAMADWSDKLSTEELHAKISAASKSMEQYLRDADACVKEGTEGPTHTKVLGLFAQAGYNPAQAKQGLDEMKTFTKTFWHAGMHRDGTGNGTGTNLKTNRQGLELSVALRDAGGLMWGGTEMSHGGDNGDFMHFDIRQDATGAQFAAALAEARTPLK
ncbi:MAG TPA: hypothetical protein VH165_09310 [Kofleriaceae bacterium]|jgi:hypothetical protein|nr:hypothetical protein [Kofleriaceae bacterium]